jgi:sn-glycerol 3-phosphate transport system substrate-binding protein
MTFWHSLPFEHKVTPPGIAAWPELPPDFMQGNTAIIQHTTGSLTNFRNNLKQFPFGIAGLPGKDGPRTVVGGGNMYFFKSASEAERKAALRFVRFLTEPERAADWCMKTGYIATCPAAYETAALKKYVADYPPADVARGFLPVAVGELSTHENQRVYVALTDQIQACLNDKVTPAQAMEATQAEATRILRPYKRG